MKLEMCSTCRRSACFAGILPVVLLLSLASLSQTPKSESVQPATAITSEPVATFKASSRIVTLEVVVKDKNGHHVSGLKSSDFEVFEVAPSRGKKPHEQKIAAFREVHMADIVAREKPPLPLPEGVYTNLVTLQEDPVPPTILLVDGLNTPPIFQAQVHVQMLKMLRALPKDVPVAVFLMGHRLRLIQSLTSDSSVLQTALEKLPTVADGVGISTIDPRDDPNEVSAQLENIGLGGQAHVSAEVIDAAKQFEQFVYAGNMDYRVNETIEALTSLARHLGRIRGGRTCSGFRLPSQSTWGLWNTIQATVTIGRNSAAWRLF
jgi:VWFA-related protein